MTHLPPAAPVAGSQTTAHALLGAIIKVALLTRALPSAVPGCEERLASVAPLALQHHNGLLHLADALLMIMPVGCLSKFLCLGLGQPKCKLNQLGE